MLSKAKGVLLIGTILIISVMFLGGCDMVTEPSSSPTPSVPATPTTLNDIAHNVNERLGFTVYIPENGEDVPYYVLTNNYNNDGNCLLLRKHLLDEMIVFNYLEAPVNSYYEQSNIDKYLCNEFLPNLSSINDIIINSEILITHIDSIGSSGKKNINIKRKVFLLSRSEISSSESTANEGVPIECLLLRKISGYGDENKNALTLQIATTAAGEPKSWWLRTPQTWFYNMVYGVSYEGGSAPLRTGGTEVTAFGYDDYMHGVRPAFCLSPDTAIYEDEVDGEKRYFISLE